METATAHRYRHDRSTLLQLIVVFAVFLVAMLVMSLVTTRPTWSGSAFTTDSQQETSPFRWA